MTSPLSPPRSATSTQPGPDRPWTAIAALADNRVIGSGNRIPWHLPEDFRWFKSTTMGGTLVMGRRTYESIGRPLPGRTTVVLSRSGFHDDRVLTLPSLDAVAERPDLPQPVFICGGAEIYQQALDRCATLLLTRVHAQPEGDAFFPEFEPAFRREAVLRETPEFTIERWGRPG